MAALLLGTLSHGGLAVSEQVPKELVQVLQAIIILSVAGVSAYRGGLLERARAAVSRKPPPGPEAKRDPAEGDHG